VKKPMTHCALGSVFVGSSRAEALGCCLDPIADIDSEEWPTLICSHNDGYRLFYLCKTSKRPRFNLVPRSKSSVSSFFNSVSLAPLSNSAF
jgi:hypothetical protein